ncbi:PilW family protein [Pseudomonas sp. LjRoot71]|uniref:PilW family protein n=1 Tax=Pseudomonas sp. LjRoot71 TaxID=3342336 RepID=UPI003ECFFB92
MSISYFTTLRRTQLGLSVVELMVAMALGLLLMTGVIQVFLSSRQTYAANEAMGRLQENGRFALEFIARSARIAGYTDPIYAGNKPSTLVPTDTCSGFPADICNNISPTLSVGTDTIAFVYQPPKIDDKRRDCQGTEVADNVLIVSQYYVSGGSLRCRSYDLKNGTWIVDATARELISGVDSLQVLYGINTSGDSRSANQYVSADRVTNLNKWNDVRAVRISVLANSIDNLTPAPAGRNFVLLDAAPLAFNDSRARQIFSTTIQLKNTF